MCACVFSPYINPFSSYGLFNLCLLNCDEYRMPGFLQDINNRHIFLSFLMMCLSPVMPLLNNHINFQIKAIKYYDF
jgi:hypothetical protein